MLPLKCTNPITDGSEEQQNIRSKRAKKPRTPGAQVVVAEPDQRLDNDQSENSSPVIPTGFLSPSVKEYLELGKSIPGMKMINFNLTKKGSIKRVGRGVARVLQSQ